MKVFKAVLFSFLLVVASFQIAKCICCEDIKSEVEEKELAHTKLCSTVTSDLAKCCENLGMDVERQRKAFETLCPEISQFYVNFTNLGAAGRLGPTSLGSHYVGEDHENMTTVQNGIQFWTVPYTGTYEITAVGAAGGYDQHGPLARGRGAYMKGEFNLIKNDVVEVLVGQEGIPNTGLSSSRGGGGGSFVATSSNTPLIVAGGGGGIEKLTTRMANCDASKATSGKQNQCKATCAIWAGGVNGTGALEADRSYSGGGGGGFYSNGRSSTEFGGAYGNGGEGGRGFIQGGAGGRAVKINAVGGFGGGGGAYGAGGGAGGGGGYSGGASGNNNFDSCGGGGGSYNIGKNQVNKDQFRANGHGYVEIRRIA